MRDLLFLALCLGLAACGPRSLRPSEATPPAGMEELVLADPTVFVENHSYYLTGTNGRGANRFVLYASQDLKHWTRQATVLAKGQDTWGERGFWAPQLLHVGQEYLLTYTASEHTALARSGQLSGPFTQEKAAPIDSTAKNIDSFLFQDEDGSWYLYHVRFNRGNFIWVAAFDMATGTIRKETLRQCLWPTQAWETSPAYPSNPIMEGPTVVKLEGKYYLFYSANHFQSVDYAVGYAVADSPWGPWEKYEGNPILHRSLVGENGSGHGDLFFSPQGEPYYVYHVHQSPDQVGPRKTRILPLKTRRRAGILEFSAQPKRRIVPLTEKE